MIFRVDGGVSQNDFMMQLIADLSGLKVERPASSEMSIMGVAFLAGMEAGWQLKWIFIASSVFF